jgi:hypothetical protein
VVEKTADAVTVDLSLFVTVTSRLLGTDPLATDTQRAIWELSVTTALTVTPVPDTETVALGEKLAPVRITATFTDPAGSELGARPRMVGR